MPPRQLLPLWTAIFCTFAMIGFALDIIGRGRQPATLLALNVVASGLIATGWAIVSMPPRGISTRRRPLAFAVMVGVHVTYVAVIPRAFDYQAAAPPWRLTIDAAGTVGDIPIKGDPAFAYSVIFSPDKKTVYGTMDDLTAIDVAKKKYAASVPHPEGTSYGINVTSDGKKIYVGGGGATLMVYDASTLKVLKTLQMDSDGMDIRRVTF